MVETTKNLGGAPEGNDNAAKGARWRNAINKALENKCKGDGQKALVKAATKLLEAVDKGEGWAIKELGDRMDGKAAQSLTVSGDEDAPLVVKKVKFVKPSTD